MHVTLRVRREVPTLRSRAVTSIMRPAFAAGCDRFGFRLTHYSRQGNHMHLIVEAQDARALARGMKGLAVRIARGINRLTGRRNKPVFADRYHSRPLRTPTEVRNCLNYVLNNAHVHARRDGYRRRDFERFDPYSSACWFDGWKRPPRAKPVGPPPLAAPETWLLRVGWRRLGLL